MITLSEASLLVKEAMKIAAEWNVQLSIAVCDDHGELVAFSRMDGVGLQTGPLAIAKAYTAARMRKSTLLLGEWAIENGKDISHWVDPKIAGLGGGLPIVRNNKVIGGMGVSGLSPQQDEEVVSLSTKVISEHT